MRYIWTFIVIVSFTLTGCYSPRGSGVDLKASGGEPATATSVPDDSMQPPSDINQSWTFAGSCIHPAGFCVQVYGSEAAGAIASLVVMGKKGCRLLEPGSGKPQCMDLFTGARCLGQPRAMTDTVDVQMDLYFRTVPDKKSQASCTDNGGTFTVLSNP